jgi:hypothetical protein
MSLIRCLGQIKLPSAYRIFMDLEVDDFKRKRRENFDPEKFDQSRVFDRTDLPYQNDAFKTYHGKEGRRTVAKPEKCRNLEASLAAINAGKQIHTCMTVVSMSEHADDEITGEKSTVLIIPYQVSEHHYLWVEGEKRQLLANHIYAFNQTRVHALLYCSQKGLSRSSKPCSLLNVSFIDSARKR